MTTLKTKQAEFLNSYIMMLITDDVTDKLKALRETDEWKQAIEDGKKDEKILESIEEDRKNYETKNKIKELKTQVEELSKDIKYDRYTIAWINPDEDCCRLNDARLEEAQIITFDEEYITKRVAEELDHLASKYAIEKTGFVQNFTSWSHPYDKILKQVEARLSVTSLANFDDIVEGTLSHIDTDEIVQQVIEHNKSTS